MQFQLIVKTIFMPCVNGTVLSLILLSLLNCDALNELHSVLRLHLETVEIYQASTILNISIFWPTK